MKLARALVVALLVLLFTVTPLNALILPGQFEVRFGTHAPGLTVRIDDRTGLVSGVAPAAPGPGIAPVVANRGSDRRTLLVTLEGSSCDFLIELTFERAGATFLITERTHTASCGLGTGAEHVVALILRAPVDASSVKLESGG